MTDAAEGTRGVERVGRWWQQLAPKDRQRILLGTLLAAALAARDLLLLGFAGAMLAALELTPEVGRHPQAAA